MDIAITAGTNTKSERVTRVRVEISDHDLALCAGNPDRYMKILARSGNAASARLSALVNLASAIERGRRRAKA